MQLLTGAEGAKRIGNFISRNHQIHAYSVDLTAKQIYSLEPTGEVDFGGSEYVAAGRHPLPTHKKHSQDRYEWWMLMHGAYELEFNETIALAEDEIALVEPHERLLRAGGEHPAIFFRGELKPLTILLTVAGGRLQVKQNSRISTLRVFRLAAGARRGGPAKAAKAKKKR